MRTSNVGSRNALRSDLDPRSQSVANAQRSTRERRVFGASRGLQTFCLGLGFGVWAFCFRPFSWSLLLWALVDRHFGLYRTISYFGYRLRPIRGVGPNLENWAVSGLRKST